MVPASLRASTTPAPPREFGAAFLLVFTSLLAQYLLPAGLDHISTVAVTRADPRLVGAVVYTVLGLAALALVVAVARYRAGAPVLAPDERVQLGGAAMLVLFAGTYWLHGTVALPVFPESLLQPLASGGVAMGVVALGYARLRNIDLRAALPDRDAYPLAGATVGLAALAGIAWAVLVIVNDPPLLSFAVGSGPGPAFGPELSASRVARDALLPAVLVGAGSGLLYNAAIQESLREWGSARAVATVTALVGTVSWAFTLLARPNTVLGMVGSLGAVAVLAVLAGTLAAVAVTVLDDYAVAATPAVGAGVGILVVAVPLAAVGLVRPATGSIVPYSLSYTVAGAVAAYGYERTQSVWVPAAAFAAYLTVVSWDVVVFLAEFV